MPRQRWRKSSYSGEGGNNCVEVAAAPDRISVRDSKNPARILSFSRPAFTALVRGVASR
nr:DUF397 domain-containing protein [Streptomyces sp. CRN 30]